MTGPPRIRWCVRPDSGWGWPVPRSSPPWYEAVLSRDGSGAASPGRGDALRQREHLHGPVSTTDRSWGDPQRDRTVGVRLRGLAAGHVMVGRPAIESSAASGAGSALDGRTVALVQVAALVAMGASRGS